MDCRFPKITQDGCDGSETQGFIANLWDGAAAGFKYFSCHGIKQVTVTTRGLGSGVIELLTAWDGKPVGEFRLQAPTNGKTTKPILQFRMEYTPFISDTGANETSAFIHLR